MRNNDENTVVLTPELSFFFIILPFKSAYHSKTRRLILVTLSLTYIFEMRKYNFLKKLTAFSVFDRWFSENVMSKFSEKSYLVKTSCCFALINNLNVKKFPRRWNSKCGSYPTFAVDTYNKNRFNTFNVKSVFARTYVRQKCLIQVDK